ncbi:putative RING-H2 finger protein ATL53 [Acorus gramineus]|uniref:RING-H2 finger protein ATL53 n=1 Tax=Acorus gramineus TaxID=55184 RepID=A0AAV9B9K7_ACOGR|nr:putative RING-H2 finger protein ATL53 [Acorus gramineus]
MDEAIFQNRIPRCLNMSTERVEWPTGKCSANEKFVNIDFCVTDYFMLGLLQSSSGLILHVGSEQTFRKTSTVIQPLEDVLHSSDFGNEVEDMLLRVVQGGEIFNIYTKCISDYIHKEASMLGPEHQMLRIIVSLEDLLVLICDETFFLNNYMTTKLENVECNSSIAMAEACPVCLEKLMEFEKDEKEIKRTPCGHMFHGICIERWWKMTSTCPMCRFYMPLPKIRFTIIKNRLSWTCETDFQALMRVTPDAGWLIE